MSAPILPEGITEDDEIEVDWVRKGKKTIVTIQLGKAKIVVSTTPKSADALQWLVASLPQVLNAAYDQIEAQEAS